MIKKNLSYLFATITLFLMGSTSLHAHPLAPGLLALTETQTHQFQSVWKLPNKIADRGALLPTFPEDCEMKDIQLPVATGTGRSQSFKLICQSALFNQKVGVQGMSLNTSGVLLRINFLDDSVVHQMLNYQRNSLIIPAKQSLLTVFTRYVTLGVEHLIQGIDHVLFVITLAILVGWNRKLFWTITLFTLGHSITLSLASLGFIRFPVLIIEAMIALSIAWAATDVINNKTKGVFKKRPWIMSGGFGLLHGMGFATALSDIGLPQQALTISLAAFNIGIEIGQLIVIAVFFAGTFTIKRMANQWRINTPPWLKPLICYAIATAGSVWFWQRLFGI